MSKLYRWTLEALPDGGAPEVLAQATGSPRMAAKMIAAAGEQLAAELAEELIAAGFLPAPDQSPTNGGGRRVPRKRAAPAKVFDAMSAPDERVPDGSVSDPGPQLPPAERIPVGTEHAFAPSAPPAPAPPAAVDPFARVHAGPPPV